MIVAQPGILSALLKAALLPVVLLYRALPEHGRVFFDVPCLFLALTDIHCPGCGMKTAIVRLLDLDWPGAIAINPLAPAALACILWVSAAGSINLVSRKRGNLWPN